MSILSVEHLTVAFEKRTVFRDLSFSVEDGEYLCILGENGSGKTTLMQTLLGLNRNYGGTVRLNGITAREIGWLPQRAVTKRDFPANVSEVILSGFAGKGVLGAGYSRAQKKLAAEKMELLGITELARRPYRELSGGQQQKVLLCRALCAANRLLLLDEPVTGLDAASQTELYDLIRRLHTDGMTVMMISHDVSHALDEATHILHLSEHDYFFGTPQDYRATEFYTNLTERRRHC